MTLRSKAAVHPRAVRLAELNEVAQREVREQRRPGSLPAEYFVHVGHLRVPVHRTAVGATEIHM